MKIAAINGSRHMPDVVTDEDLETIAELQAASWRADKLTQEANAGLRSRILHGAIVRAKRYYWDSSLGMVRSRKDKTG